MPKRIALMLFFVAVMMSVVGFAERPVAHAVARYKTIYDGTMGSLIDSMNEELHTFGLQLKKERYYHCKQHDRKHCVVYTSTDKQSYILFDLNDDNSVVDAYFVFADLGQISENNKMMEAISPIMAFLISIGMNYREYSDLWGGLADYVDATKNTGGLSSINKTFYGHSSGTGKNIYMTVKAGGDDSAKGTFYFGLAKNQ